MPTHLAVPHESEDSKAYLLSEFYPDRLPLSSCILGPAALTGLQQMSLHNGSFLGRWQCGPLYSEHPKKVPRPCFGELATQRVGSMTVLVRRLPTK